MKSSYIIIILIECLSFVNVQGQHNILIGTRSKSVKEGKLIDLSTDNIQILPEFSSPHPMTMTSTALFNEADKALLYSNGCYIFNDTHDTLLNISLQKDSEIEKYCKKSGSVISNSTMFVPVPNSPQESYFIYIKGSSKEVVNSNFPELIMLKLHIERQEKIDSLIIPSIYPGNFDITMHHNGIDYWLALIDKFQKKILLYIITSDGINLHEEIDLPLLSQYEDCINNINVQFSLTNQKILIHANNCYLATYDFDPCGGDFSNQRINVSTGSYNIGGEATFSMDGNFIVLNRDIYSEFNHFVSGNSEIQIFRTNKIGISIQPDVKLSVDPNFSMGKIIATSNNRFYVFNRYSDHKYIKLQINTGDPLSLEQTFINVPYWYYPSFSRQIGENKISNLCVTGVASDDSKDLFNVFPNPGNNEITVSIRNFEILAPESEFEVTIWDARGKKIAMNILLGMHLKLDISTLAPGTYFLDIVNTEGHHVLKKFFVYH